MLCRVRLIGSDEHGVVHTDARWDDAARAPNTVLVLVEPGSTHTGNNVEYTLQLLNACGCDVRGDVIPRAIVVQQPALLARAGATFRKWTGFQAQLWTTSMYTPDEDVEWAAAKLLVMSLGEYRRFPAYAGDLAFVTAPEDFPWQYCTFAQRADVMAARRH